MQNIKTKKIRLTIFNWSFVDILVVALVDRQQIEEFVVGHFGELVENRDLIVDFDYYFQGRFVDCCFGSNGFHIFFLFVSKRLRIE